MTLRTKLAYHFKGIHLLFHWKARRRDNWRKLLCPVTILGFSKCLSPSPVCPQSSSRTCMLFQNVAWNVTCGASPWSPWKQFAWNGAQSDLPSCMWVRLLSHAEHPRVGRDSLQHTPPLLRWCRQHSPLVHRNDLFSRPKYQSGANLVCPTIKNEWWCCLGHLSPSTQDTVLRIDFCSDQNSYLRGGWDQIPLGCGAACLLCC